MKNLIFDYDGTLHNCIKIYAPAFREVCSYLSDLGQLEKANWTDAEISKFLGYNSKDTWDLFAPNLEQQYKDKCSAMIGQIMIEHVRTGKAELYGHVPETLKTLKDSGYRLMILSNCKQEYLNAHRQYFGLDQYFSAYYCAQAYDFKPKYEIFPVIQKQYSGEFIMIGDRFHDMEVAHKHGLRSIGCNYGYGTPQELKNATGIADSAEQMVELINLF